jgi:hypothetical protein
VEPSFGLRRVASRILACSFGVMTLGVRRGCGIQKAPNPPFFEAPLPTRDGCPGHPCLNLTNDLHGCRQAGIMRPRCDEIGICRTRHVDSFRVARNPGTEHGKLMPVSYLPEAGFIGQVNRFSSHLSPCVRRSPAQGRRQRLRLLFRNKMNG